MSEKPDNKWIASTTSTLLFGLLLDTFWHSAQGNNISIINTDIINQTNDSEKSSRN